MSQAAVSESTVKAYLQALASTASVPGGGSAAAVAGAMGCALVSMVAKISARKAADEAARQVLQALTPAADRLVERLAALSQDDIDAFRAVVAARKQGDAESAVQRAYRRAAEVPLETAHCAEEGLGLVARLQPLAWEMTASDVEAAQSLLQAALAGALSNVAVNLPELDGSDRSRIQPDYERLRRQAR